MYNATQADEARRVLPDHRRLSAEAAPGYFFHFEDPMQFHQLSASFSVSPFGNLSDNERLHADIEYKTLNWKLRYWHNDADFYDLFGPVERSRKGDVFIVGYNKTTIYDPPRQLDLFGTAAAFFGLEQLPSAQNVASPKNIGSVEAGVQIHQHPQVAGRRRP